MVIFYPYCLFLCAVKRSNATAHQLTVSVKGKIRTVDVTRVRRPVAGVDKPVSRPTSVVFAAPDRADSSCH